LLLLLLLLLVVVVVAIYILYISSILFAFFQLMKLGQKVLGHRLFSRLMKATFYGHFVAGEDRQTIKPAIHRMHTFGVKVTRGPMLQNSTSAVHLSD
jgi:hypothetical protein